MLGVRKEMLEGPSFAPRAHLEGLKLPASFQLPAMHMVTEDIVKRESQLAEFLAEF